MKDSAEVMGTVISIDVRTPGLHPQALRAAFGALRAADARFSPFLPGSELSRAARGELSPASFSQDLREVLEIGRRFQRASGGVFSVGSGGSLDANGVVKGWAVDRAGRILRAAGADDFCINAGGDVLAHGSPGQVGGSEGSRGWNVGVRSPWDAHHMLAVLVAEDCGVATSGSYERGEHIVNQATGEPARGLASVTVVARDLTTADVLATTVFAQGPDGVGWATAMYPCSVIAVLPDGELLSAGPLPLAVGR